MYVLWLRDVLMYFDCCYVQMCAVGMDESCGFPGTVPNIAMICVSSEGGDLVGNYVLRD